MSRLTKTKSIHNNKPKLNQPDVEITTTTVYSDFATKITNPYIEPDDVSVTNIHIYIHNSALTEVKKEWETTNVEDKR